jgi:hypothetical protein
MNTAQQGATQRIVDSLLHLEIDVIIKPGMTARKMPDPPQALIDIIGWYDNYLRESATDLNLAWDRKGRLPVNVRLPGPPGAPPQSPNRQTNPDGTLTLPLRLDSVPDLVSEDSFDALRERAVEAEAVYSYLVGRKWFPEDDKGVVLTRIYRNCDQIKSILFRPEVKAVLTDGVTRDEARAVALPISSADIITIRKIWEIGIETVVMQTVVQLDGDVITRIQQGRETAANKPLHDLHQEAVGNAARHWEFLVQTVTQFLTSALRDFFLR